MGSPGEKDLHFHSQVIFEFIVIYMHVIRVVRESTHFHSQITFQIYVDRGTCSPSLGLCEIIPGLR